MVNISEYNLAPVKKLVLFTVLVVAIFLTYLVVSFSEEPLSHMSTMGELGGIGVYGSAALEY